MSYCTHVVLYVLHINIVIQYRTVQYMYDMYCTVVNCEEPHLFEPNIAKLSTFNVNGAR